MNQCYIRRRYYIMLIMIVSKATAKNSGPEVQ